MTKQRFDGHSTELGLWLRQQSEIDSKLGFIATNLDYIWMNYKTGQWMLIEEKRYSAGMKEWQLRVFKKIAYHCSADPDFCGFHFIRFEKLGPQDGKILWDEIEITPADLILKLRFEL